MTDPFTVLPAAQAAAQAVAALAGGGSIEVARSAVNLSPAARFAVGMRARGYSKDLVMTELHARYHTAVADIVGTAVCDLMDIQLELLARVYERQDRSLKNARSPEHEERVRRITSRAADNLEGRFDKTTTRVTQ